MKNATVPVVIGGTGLASEPVKMKDLFSKMM